MSPTLLACLPAMRQSYRYCSYGADRTCNRSGQVAKVLVSMSTLHTDFMYLISL